ncbi:hypothetical protein EDB89DRAFT_1905045 [Lactarius sanguifluus]|nr:hypothetical protein EDB89DRAFT_1905045 [Lactarius sanguifluus]
MPPLAHPPPAPFAPFCVCPPCPFTCKWGTGKPPSFSLPAPVSAQMGHANLEWCPPPTPVQERSANGQGANSIRHPLVACAPPPIEWWAHAPCCFPLPARLPPLPNWHAPFAHQEVRKQGMPTGAAKWGGAQMAFAPTLPPVLPRPLLPPLPLLWFVMQRCAEVTENGPGMREQDRVPLLSPPLQGKGAEWRSGSTPLKRVGKLCVRRRGAAPALVHMQMGHTNGEWGAVQGWEQAPPAPVCRTCGHRTGPPPLRPSHPPFHATW